MQKVSYFYKGLYKSDLIIFDTIFPHPVSGFRLEEFTSLLSEFKTSKILVNPEAYNFLNTAEELHPIHINELVRKNPDLKNKLKPIRGFVNINTKLFYCLFISHIYRYIEILEKHQISFVFTLYPGSDFQMNNEECDQKLRRTLSSKMFKKVIVTQKVTKDYLLKKNFCTEDQIEFIFGCVVPQNSLIKDLTAKQYYSQGKDTLDICFCAAKYMPRGVDKGYDVFIEVAHKLLLKYNFVKFHIVGGFTENDIDVTAILNNIHFYGYQDFDQLQGIFKKMDILISPNKPFLLRNGSFDGFPLGTVVEAALNGVMVMLSDGLEQNTTFVNDEEVVIIDSDSKLIETILEELINEPQRIAQIAKKGTLKFQEIYSNEAQMTPRLKVLKNIISNS
ncbi:glycosyltransferase family 4 protein [Chryseobacterium sp. MP_3.2]|uniref:glycosyltransferase family 4 protein n=1 Tax=Chryseobacterium sp. MP_3.2 TaxID=3071712 RepID=UPI002E0B61FB|nr:glycosyltransferase involved in cell wall biosynthesis [Chryseobacterium sp. MP_3.2]